MKLYGLLGNKLAHSFSVKYFFEKFQSDGISDKFGYRNFEIPDLNEFIKLVDSETQLFGLNVTIPYKEKIIPYLNNVDEVAADTGAVNTIKIQRGSTGNLLFMEGYNTDAVGFQSAISPLLLPHHKGALILGNGGAAKAVQFTLKKMAIPFISVTRQHDSNLMFDELKKDHFSQYPVIINTTPLGTFPEIDDSPPIPYHLLSPENLLFDLVYNPEMTTFMKQGIAHGAKVENGLKMLQAQAEASWEIWNS
ncbi:MAG: shikimate dehydrogenase [Bacteroidia bacterium]|nr:shikimate dehydrogenase [Bacteroidia bacterium]